MTNVLEQNRIRRKLGPQDCETCAKLDASYGVLPGMLPPSGVNEHPYIYRRLLQPPPSCRCATTSVFALRLFVRPPPFAWSRFWATWSAFTDQSGHVALASRSVCRNVEVRHRRKRPSFFLLLPWNFRNDRVNVLTPSSVS